MAKERQNHEAMLRLEVDVFLVSSVSLLELYNVLHLRVTKKFVKFLCMPLARGPTSMSFVVRHRVSTSPGKRALHGGTPKAVCQ